MATMKRDGKTIEITLEEAKSARSLFSTRDCESIVVAYDDGTTARPYRFIDSNPSFTSVEKPDGTRVLVM